MILTKSSLTHVIDVDAQIDTADNVDHNKDYPECCAALGLQTTSKQHIGNKQAGVITWYLLKPRDRSRWRPSW